MSFFRFIFYMVILFNLHLYAEKYTSFLKNLYFPEDFSFSVPSDYLSVVQSRMDRDMYQFLEALQEHDFIWEPKNNYYEILIRNLERPDEFDSHLTALAQSLRKRGLTADSLSADSRYELLLTSFEAPNSHIVQFVMGLIFMGVPSDDSLLSLLEFFKDFGYSYSDFVYFVSYSLGYKDFIHPLETSQYTKTKWNSVLEHFLRMLWSHSFWSTPDNDSLGQFKHFFKLIRILHQASVSWQDTETRDRLVKKIGLSSGVMEVLFEKSESSHPLHFSLAEQNRSFQFWIFEDWVQSLDYLHRATMIPSEKWDLIFDFIQRHQLSYEDFRTLVNPSFDVNILDKELEELEKIQVYTSHWDFQSQVRACIYMKQFGLNEHMQTQILHQISKHRIPFQAFEFFVQKGLSGLKEFLNQVTYSIRWGDQKKKI